MKSRKVQQTAAKVRNKAKEEKRFYCEVCDLALASQQALDSHITTKRHHDAEEGNKKTTITKSAVAVKAVRSAAKEAKLHY